MTLPRFIASGFGSGLLRPAPGTIGSFVALLLGAAMMWLWPPLLPVAAGVFYLAGLWAVAACDAVDDPGWVVVDEFVGQWIAMLPLASLSAPGLLAAFVLFRVFDIVKPGPIRTAENMGGAQGVMADDVVAGAVAAGLIWMVRTGWPGLLD
jgi:phosphatidylglycerophosphatase A